MRKEEGLTTENTNLIKDGLPNSKLRWKMANVAVTLKTKLNRKKSNRGCHDIIENRENISMDASTGNTGFDQMIACQRVYLEFYFNCSYAVRLRIFKRANSNV